MKNLFIYLFVVLAIGLIFYACDSTTAPNDPLTETPAIVDFDITPSNINFTPSDGVRDTTVNIQFSGSTAHTEEGQTVTLNIIDSNSGELVSSEELAINEESQSFQYEFNFETLTTFFTNFSVNAYLNQENTTSGFAEGQISVQGFSVYPPEIVEINTPDSIALPTGGESARAVAFQAKVSDPEGLASIQGVYLRLISRSTGELSGSPFLLYDNATNGDGTAGDSLFTRGFQFNSGNEADEYDVQYYAVDRGGLTSDTVKTTFIVTD